jgi:hypothetical protein
LQFPFSILHSIRRLLRGIADKTKPNTSLRLSNPRIPTSLLATDNQQLATLPRPGYTFAMATKPIRIWCNMNFPAPATQLLREGTREHTLVFAANLQASNLVPGQPDPALADATSGAS